VRSFDGRERVIAMGDHMPVHLGAIPMSVKAVVDSMTLEEGDVAILNDPYAGGTHLPDITLVLPIFPLGFFPSGAFSPMGLFLRSFFQPQCVGPDSGLRTTSGAG
jgi:hypothetical protein